ncbi:hypothetical protein CKF54_04740 [Psittacicella hinzii]|uniref:Metallo-beta-lactamase domain-containing protein n=1 Tax=Psittacicella hinzii TaxID=2028575 RepID=A0A3A1Y8N0_9GAMM|nr:MBL fold metallo-hydrolase [Psittacicella hinzii]RIY32484.1 hypothetical protein CKF54_04740 [Psittacicella hinzii]
MAKLEIYKLPVGAIQQNCRIFVNVETKEAFVVDPGAQAQDIFNFISKNNLKVEAIILTHGHFDHIGGVEPLRKLLGDVKVIGPFAQDGYMFNKALARAQEFGFDDEVADFNQDPTKGDRFFEEGEVLTLAGQEYTVLFTPGHSPGHGVLVDKDNRIIIAGDLLFRGSVGRTDLEGSSFADLEASLQNKVYPLEGDYTVLPGHGPDTTLERERKLNPYVRAKEVA